MHTVLTVASISFFFFLWNSVSLKQVNIETEESFWMTLGSCIEQYACTHIDFKSASVFESVDDMKIISSDYFHLVFMKRNWNSNVVIIIDDFDKMCEANDDVKISCLANFRCIRNSRYNYAIGSIIAIGTSSRILDLNPITMVTSPFSFSETFQNPNFTFNQVQDLYRKFATDYDFTIDPEVIKDIYKQTSGYVLMSHVKSKSHIYFSYNSVILQACWPCLPFRTFYPE